MTNFTFLKQEFPLLYQLGIAAEQAFVPDPNTTLYKIRKLGEALAQEICAYITFVYFVPSLLALRYAFNRWGRRI